MYQNFTVTMVTERHYHFMLISYIFTAPLFYDHLQAKIFEALVTTITAYMITSKFIKSCIINFLLFYKLLLRS